MVCTLRFHFHILLFFYLFIFFFEKLSLLSKLITSTYNLLLIYSNLNFNNVFMFRFLSCGARQVSNKRYDSTGEKFISTLTSDNVTEETFNRNSLVSWKDQIKFTLHIAQLSFRAFEVKQC